ncbi:MAG: response regulator [Desulfobacterales bacterium]
MKKMFSILIVEDNPDDVFLLRELLESSEEVHFKILHEDRMDKAKSAAMQYHVDVAVIDLSLPDSFGIDTFHSFHDAFPQIPVVIMTGSKDYELALETVRNGAQDYLFKGEHSATAIVRTLRYAIERQQLMTELTKAMDQIKQLKGMLPICSACKKIRDDRGYWKRIEAYIMEHSDATFTHSICPECALELYPELYKKNTI